MRALALDYGRKPFGAGTLVLVAGLALAAAAAFEAHALRGDVALAQARIAELGRVPKPQSAANVKGARESSAQDAALANGVLARLALPWDALFASIEAVRSENVALLSIEPDAGKATVKIGAEAKSANDMLDYVRQLAQADGLRQVTLISHQTRAEETLSTVRFIVMAEWTTRP